MVASDVTKKETKAGVLRWLDELLMSGMCEQRKVGIAYLRLFMETEYED